MNTSFKVAKYQLYILHKAVEIFYSIILLVVFASILISTKEPERVTFGGLGTATIIFISIAGMDCFKSGFRFMMANNITRKRFYYGNTYALAALAAFMAVVDTAINGVVSSLIRYESLFEQLYGINDYFADYLWSFGLYALAGCLGWLFTMIYYRLDGAMKFLFFIIPLIVGMPFGYVDRRTGGVLGRAVIGLLDRAMGVTQGNPNIGSFSLFVSATVVLVVCFLLLRRAPLKD